MFQSSRSYSPVKKLSGIVLAIILLASCKPDKLKVYSNFYQYYPLNVGSYLVYNADSIIYFNATLKNRKPDTILYQIMDSVQSKFIDGTGQIAYRVQESRRKNSSAPWKIVRAFTRSVNDRNAQEVDGNNRYIKMIFPVEKNSDWNPDIYNTIDSAHVFNAQYVQVHVPYFNQTLSFDSTVLVQLQNDTTLINSYKYNERYAAEIGLIGIQHDSVFDYVIPQQDTAFQGYRYKQTLSDYGPKK